MAFPTTPTSHTLPMDEYDRLAKLLTMHYAYPLPYPLAGAHFETLFAAAGGQREERKLLFDVLRQKTGWSLKTLLTNRDTFEVVIQRCDILRERAITLDSPVALLGERILSHFNEFCEVSG